MLPSLYAARLKAKYNLFFVNQLSLVMTAKTEIKYAKKHHKRLMVYCRDLWAEGFIVDGFKCNSLMYKFLYVTYQRIYYSAVHMLMTKSCSNVFSGSLWS